MPLRESEKTQEGELDDDESDGSVTPTPDGEIHHLPEGVTEELSRISQSQAVLDRMVAIATCLAPQNPKASLLLDELKKLERK